MLISASIQRAHLRAALVTAAHKDGARPQLVGLLCEIHPDRVFLIGTDGILIGVCRSVTMLGVSRLEAGEFIIPRKLAEKIKVSKRCPTVDVHFDTNTQAITLTDDGTTHTGRALEGQPIDWRRALPKSASGETAKFNVLQAATFAKAAKELGHRENAVLLWPNGKAAALVQILHAPEYIGGLMPLNVKTESPNTTGFADKHPL